MSHRTPGRSAKKAAAPSSSTRRPATAHPTGSSGSGSGSHPTHHSNSNFDSSTSYSHYHAAHAAADSSSDEEEIDPRWTHPKVLAASQRRRGSSSASHSRPAASPSSSFTSSSSSPSPFAPRTSPTSPPSAAAVHEQWRKGIGVPSDSAPAHAHPSSPSAGGGEGPFTGVPRPSVDLTGMTSEQRELLEYLQARVESFERERVDFLTRLDEMQGSSHQRHSMKWDLAKKDEQIMDLQRALSDAHVFLYEERAQVLKLTAENDRLKIQEMEDRQRLEHLMALTQPINQEVTYFRECRPEKLTKVHPSARDDIYANQRGLSEVEPALDEPRRQVFATGSGASSARGRGGDASFHNNSSMLSHSSSQFGSQSARVRKVGGSGSTKKKNGGAGNGSLRPVVRTIYLPNENIEILKRIIASLRAQLTEQHTLFEQRIQALQEDRAIREQETAEVQRRANKHIQELAEELKGVNELNKMTTRDYLELRHAAQLNERKLKERASALSQQLHDLQQHLKGVENKAAQSESALQSENANYVSLFRQQTAATEEDLAILKAQYAATQDLYEKRIRYLEGRINTLKQKLRHTEERRSLELEGYTTDISHLRQKLRKFEQSLVNLKVEQMGSDGQVDPSVATTASSASSADSGSPSLRRSRRGRSSSASGNRSRGSSVPPRLAAKLALMDDDVEKLQAELSHLARKISSN